MKLFEQLSEAKNLDVEIGEKMFGDEDAVKAFLERGLVIDIHIYEQILYNIVTNAIKFNRVNGKIQIQFFLFWQKDFPQGELDKYGKTDILNFVTEIKDTGVGMDEAQLHSLFSIFERVRMQG